MATEVGQQVTDQVRKKPIKKKETGHERTYLIVDSIGNKEGKTNT